MQDELSAFAKAAELLAKPLSPTALEKEAAAKKERASGDTAVVASPQKTAPPPPKSGSSETGNGSRQNRVSPAGSCKNQPGAARRSSPAPIAKDAVRSSDKEDAADPATTLGTGARDASHPDAGANSAGILDAVASLDDFQKELKGKLNCPSKRKAGPPKMKRAPSPKVLTDMQRSEKLAEIQNLEHKLHKARGKAAPHELVPGTSSGATAEEEKHADADGDASGSKAGSVDGEDKRSEDVRLLQQQAEERVRNRRRQEAAKARDQAMREELEKQSRKAEAEAKAVQLEREAKQRVHERLKAERAREQARREEEDNARREKEERAEAGEELRKQAELRVAEREQQDRQRAKELAEAEAVMQSEKHAEYDARAAALREKTRLRMQQRVREQREQATREEEAQQRALQEKAAAAAQRELHAELNQQKARARAAEFRQRTRHEEEERQRLEEEARVLEQERAAAALRERQMKRQWRPGDPPALGSPCPAEDDEQGEDQEEFFQPEEEYGPSGASAVCGLPVAAEPRRAPVEFPGADNNLVTCASAAAEAGVPPRLPVNHGQRLGAVPLQRRAAVGPHCRPQPPRAAGGGGGSIGSRAKYSPPKKDSAPSSARARDEDIVFSDAAGGAEMRACPVAVCENDTVKCTVGFFGVGDGMMDEDEEDDAGGIHACGEIGAQPKPPETLRRRPNVDSGAEVGGRSDAKQAARGNYARPSSVDQRSRSVPGRKAAARGSGRKSPDAPQSSRSAGTVAARRRDSNGATGAQGMPRAYSQPPVRRGSPQLGQPEASPSRASSPGAADDAPPLYADYADDDDDEAGNGALCGNAAHYAVDTAVGVGNRPSPREPMEAAHLMAHAPKRAPAWKQKAIQVQSADYYLELVKAARGLGGKKSPAGGGAGGYAEQLRQRANDVEAKQRQEEGARMERGCAVVDRVQKRAIQAALSRSHSHDGVVA